MSKRNREARRAADKARAQVVTAAPVRSESSSTNTLGHHARVEISERPANRAGNNRWDALEQLRRTAALERTVQLKRDRQVRAARAAGASWTSIAKLLGVTPQAVQQRYGRVKSD